MYDTRGVRNATPGAARRRHGIRNPANGADSSDARGDAPSSRADEGSSSGEPAQGSNRAAKRPMPGSDSDGAKKRVAPSLCPKPGCGKYKGHVGRHRTWCKQPQRTEEGGSGSDDTVLTEREGQTDSDSFDLPLSDRAGATDDESDKDLVGTSSRPTGATSVDAANRCPVWGCVKRARHCGRHMVRLPDGSRPPRQPRVDVGGEQQILSPPDSMTPTMTMITRRKGVRGPPVPGSIDDFDVDGDDPLAGTPFEHGIASAVFAPPPAPGAWSAQLRLNGQLDCGDSDAYGEAGASSTSEGDDMEGGDVTEGEDGEEGAEGAEGEDVMDHDGAMAAGHRTIDEMLVAMDTPLATAACTDGASACLMGVLETSSPRRSPLEMEMEHRLEGAEHPGVRPNASLADIAAAVAGVGPDGSASSDAISGWIDGLFGEVDSFDPNSSSPFGAHSSSPPFSARCSSSPFGARQQRQGDDAQPRDASSAPSVAGPSSAMGSAIARRAQQTEGSAADARQAASQRNLGMLLLRLNRPRDAVKALRSAASRGDDDAARTLAQLDEEATVPASQRQPAEPSTAAAAISPAARPPPQVPPPRQVPATTEEHAPALEDVPGTSTQAITVGTRLAVLWTHGWENGTVIKVTVRKDSRRFTVAYDDGEVHDEELLDPAEWRILKGVGRPQCQRHPQCTLAAGHRGFCNKRRSVEQVASQAPPTAPVPPAAPPLAAASPDAAPVRAAKEAKAPAQGGGTRTRKRSCGSGGGSSVLDAMADYDQHMSQKHGVEPSMPGVRVQDLACTPPQMLGPLRNVVRSMKRSQCASDALPGVVAPVRIEPGRCDSDSTASTEPNDMELGAGNTSPVSASASSAVASAATLAQALPPDTSGERPLLPRAAVLAS